MSFFGRVGCGYVAAVVFYDLYLYRILFAARHLAFALPCFALPYYASSRVVSPCLALLRLVSLRLGPYLAFPCLAFPPKKTAQPRTLPRPRGDGLLPICDEPPESRASVPRTRAAGLPSRLIGASSLGSTSNDATIQHPCHPDTGARYWSRFREPHVRPGSDSEGDGSCGGWV